MVHEEFDVVLVGAGPAGLACAVTLGSYNVETLVVERRPSASTLPRATVASTSTMELLRRWSLEDAAWERSIDVEWQAWACPTLATADQGQAVEVGLPTRAQAALVSPTSPACLTQDALEPLLEDHLGSFRTVRLERRIEVVGLERRGDGGFVLTLAGPGGCRRVGAKYVIGADGVRSTVREALGIASEGEEGLATRVAVVFRGPVWELVGERRYGIYFVDHGSSFLPAGTPDRWVFAMEWDGTTEAEALSPERVTRWIRQAAGVARLPIAIERIMPVAFGVELAQRFRDGDAFLIGDAAHRVTPRGGTGLNAAIRDGFDIGWKLAWVLRDWADDRLLQSYERERRPVVEFNTQRSSRTDGSILDTAVGLNVDIGGRIPHVWVPHNGGLVSTLDLLGNGLTLFVGPDWDGTSASRQPGGPPVTIERLDAIAARGLGLSPAGSLLVRPDGAPLALRNEAVLDDVPPLPAARSAA
jgi:putative polyketide hydroxylase